MIARATCAALLAVALFGAACGDDDAPAPTCGAPEGATATCAEACTQLDAVACDIAATDAECIAICEASIAGVDPAIAGRVLACYAGVGSCRAASTCSATCGPDGGTVPFTILDAGTSDGGETDAAASD